MKCENCGNHEANIKYTQIVNGVTKEMNLCEACASQLGIESNFDFDIPVDLPSFLGEFLEEYNSTSNNFMPTFNKTKETRCNQCGMTYDEFVSTGKLGCGQCYHVFADRIDPILKNLHGSNVHVGRKARITNSKMNEKIEAKQKQTSQKPEKINKVDQLQEELKKAIKQERYEDAAKLRDEIKKLEK